MSSIYQNACIHCKQPCYGLYCNSCICPRCGMNLLNEECLNCVYGNGKPLTCNKYGGMLRGGFCFPYNFKAENSFNCYQYAYSFNDLSNNSNYLPQPQYENYLCNLCGNNSHDGYDCQQQFPFVYELELSYNQNYNGNYYSHESPSFPCCDNCGGSHETFQCQPMDQSIDFSGSNQIQTPQYPDFHPPSQEISNEVFQANHSIQNKESLENSSNEIDASSSNQEKEIPPKDSNFHQLIEECSIKIYEEQKQSLEDMMLELVKICQEKEFLCIHDNVEYLIESALNSKLFLTNSNSQRLDKKEQEVKNVVEKPAEHENYKRKCDVPISENSPVCDDHSDIFSDSKINDDISVYDDDFEDIEYVEALLADHEIVSVEEENDVEEEEVDLEDISQIQDIVLREKLLSIIRLIANIESLNDNSTPDCVFNSFKSDNSLSDNFSSEFKTFCDYTEETRSDEADLFLASDNSIQSGIENVADDSEGDVCFLEELLIDDSILSHESSDSNFEDNPSIPRPPPEPADAETDTGEEITVRVKILSLTLQDFTPSD
nr:hypothetical protein [Tanacetum cinerariifolium]